MIRMVWDDADQTRLSVTLFHETPWTWELLTAHAEALFEILSSVTHAVVVIIDISDPGTQSPPVGMLLNVPRLMYRLPDHVNAIIFFPATTMMRLLFNIVAPLLSDRARRSIMFADNFVQARQQAIERLSTSQP